MLSHAHRLAHSNGNTFLAILQSAAGRAWTKTSPEHVVRCSTVAGQLKDGERLGESSQSSYMEISKAPR